MPNPTIDKFQVDNTTYDFIDSVARSTANAAVPQARTVNNKALSSDVTLNSGDIGYDGTQTYTSGTVGAELSDLKTALTQDDTALKTTLIECLKNVLWGVTTGKEKLRAFCNSLGLAGWVDVKYATSLDSNGNIVNNAGSQREASDFIDVEGFTTITSELLNSSVLIWYALRCYDANKEYIGLADPGGTANGGISRAIPNGVKYIRLLLTNNTATGLPADLKGVYTGHIWKVSLSDGTNTVTREYYLSEVTEFEDV